MAENDQDWLRIRVSASDCPRISEEFLAEERKILGAMRFSEEYGLEFVDDAAAMFPSWLIDRAFTDDVEPLWPQ